MQCLLTLPVWCFAAIQKKNVQPAISVKVKQADSATHGFNQVTIRRDSVEVAPRNASFGRHVGEEGFGSCVGRKKLRRDELREGENRSGPEKATARPGCEWMNCAVKVGPLHAEGL